MNANKIHFWFVFFSFWWPKRLLLTIFAGLKTTAELRCSLTLSCWSVRFIKDFAYVDFLFSFLHPFSCVDYVNSALLLQNPMANAISLLHRCSFTQILYVLHSAVINMSFRYTDKWNCCGICFTFRMEFRFESRSTCMKECILYVAHAICLHLFST